jgi:hypothetical protein
MSKLTHRNALILLSRDGMACGTGGSPTTYNLPLHIAALFIILTVSTAACAFPLLILRAPRLRIPPTFLFTVRHFGTGVSKFPDHLIVYSHTPSIPISVSQNSREI